MVKQKLTLITNKDIITQAKKQQINLSSFLKIRLIDYLSDKEICSRRGLRNYLTNTATDSAEGLIDKLTENEATPDIKRVVNDS